MQRTIADAIDVLDNLPGLSEEQRRLAQAEITAAQAKATTVATEMMNRRAADIGEAREGWLADLCAIRDDLAALKAKGELGRISAADYESELRQLQARQRQAEASIDQVDQVSTFVAAVEEDPQGYGESLLYKFPALRPNFTF